MSGKGNKKQRSEKAAIRKAKSPTGGKVYVAGRGGYFRQPPRPKVKEHNEACETCGMGGEILLCDGCNLVYHLECLNPPLKEAPPDDVKWFCPYCVVEMSPRHRLDHVSTHAQAIQAIRNAKRIVILAGAGISVSAGIPDFRSKSGIYELIKQLDLGPAQHKVEGQDLFDIEFFRAEPSPFFHFFRLMQYRTRSCVPTFTHYFVRSLEERGCLQRMYTQNIDGLETAAGIQQVIGI